MKHRLHSRVVEFPRGRNVLPRMTQAARMHVNLRLLTNLARVRRNH